MIAAAISFVVFVCLNHMYQKVSFYPIKWQNVRLNRWQYEPFPGKHHSDLLVPFPALWLPVDCCHPAVLTKYTVTSLSLCHTTDELLFWAAVHRPDSSLWSHKMTLTEL